MKETNTSNPARRQVTISKSEIVKLFNEGTSAKELAAKCGVSRQSIYKILKKIGVELHHHCKIRLVD